MSSEQKYNGWSNYATWRVNLEALDDYVSSLVGDGPQWSSVEECAGVLEEIVTELIDEQCYGNPTINGWASAFVSDVDYHEIAETILADNPELFTDAHHFGQYCECPECAGEPEA